MQHPPVVHEITTLLGKGRQVRYADNQLESIDFYPSLGYKLRVAGKAHWLSFDQVHALKLSRAGEGWELA